MRSITAKARPHSDSLRATIPKGIAQFLQIAAGDTLDWRMEFKEGERVVELRRMSKR
jgi:hypothetical protein